MPIDASMPFIDAKRIRAGDTAVPAAKAGTRLDLSLGLLVLLLAAASGAGYWGIASISRTTIRTLQWDAHVSERAARVRADALLLRRYEKDVFINVADRRAVERYYRK